jgi:hypothetical protein
VLHRRAVLFCKPHYWLIRDEFMGEGEHCLERYFHFAPATVFVQEGAATVLMQNAAGKGVAVVAVERENVAVALLQHGEAASAGWLAPQYGVKVGAPIARFSQTARLPLTVHTLLVPQTAPCSPDTVTVVPGDQTQSAQTLLVTSPGRRDVVVFSTAVEEISFYEGWRTDSRAASVRLNEEQEFRAGFFIQGSGLTRDGRDLLRVDRKIRCAAVLVQPGQTYIELSEPAEVATTLPNPRIVIAPTSEGMHTPCATLTKPGS